jgi:hypothetical protein
MLTGRMASFPNNQSQDDFLQVILSLLIHLTVKSRQNRDSDVSQIDPITCLTSDGDRVRNESITSENVWWNWSLFRTWILLVDIQDNHEFDACGGVFQLWQSFSTDFNHTSFNFNGIQWIWFTRWMFHFQLNSSQSLNSSQQWLNVDINRTLSWYQLERVRMESDEVDHTHCDDSSYSRIVESICLLCFQQPQYIEWCLIDDIYLKRGIIPSLRHWSCANDF